MPDASDAVCYPLPGNRTLCFDRRRPLVMGVVNITPDSFSDGGLWVDPERAAEHALRLVDDGADIVDLGAESTRPGGGIYGAGAAEVAVEEELTRLVPVLERVRSQTEAVISVDTRKPSVAAAALDLGADLINDVSGLRDERMTDLVAERACPAVLMHSRGELGSMQQEVSHRQVIDEVVAELTADAERTVEAGVRHLILDPGIGFGKSFRHNLELVNGLDRVAAIGYPVLLGASRKGYLGALTGRAPRDRLAASLATVARALGSVDVVRVHDVAETVDFLRVWTAHDAPQEAFPGPNLGQPASA